MAKIELSPLITDLSGKFGNQVFSKQNGIYRLRDNGYKPYSPSAAQELVRYYFKNQGQVWENMGSNLQRPWLVYGPTIGKTPYNAWLSQTIKGMLSGAPFSWSPPQGQDYEFSFSMPFETASQEVEVTFSPSPMPTGIFTFIYVREYVLPDEYVNVAYASWLVPGLTSPYTVDFGGLLGSANVVYFVPYHWHTSDIGYAALSQEIAYEP